MAANGVGTIRVSFSMPEIEPELGQYQFAAIDDLIRNAAARGIRVIPTIFGTTGWLNFFDGDASCGGICAPNSDQTRNYWADFAAQLVARYGPNGSFWAPTQDCPLPPLICRRGPPPCGCTSPLPIHTWQIWNEQNSSDFWAPFPNVEDYKNLVIAGGDAVHSVDPHARVILGGMLPDPSQSGKSTVTAWSFFHDLYADPRSRAAFDGVAIHPYGASLRAIKRTMWKVRTELRADGGGSDPVWITEIGWASGGEPNPLNRGPKGQAQLISEVFDFFTRKRRAFNVVNVDYYAWRDGAPDGEYCAWCRKSGLFPFHSLRPKPAWHALTEFTLGR